ncbi:hypothetical protein DPMN_171667 [Dreissena polymorpha]|uniref:Tetratricopeptide repeat protein n=1 Tax=Dreissena polymorpha TaxID=45954 RepID=A0A9D4DYE9_DREPO|nr:hypothetical protein DPMN_171667 [Dreissena polymorpha]
MQKRCHKRVKAVCGSRYIEGDRDLPVCVNMISENYYNGFIEPPFAFCVRFYRKEAYCVSSILLFEMNRNITEEEVMQRTFTVKTWMDNAEIGARTFLHYLQYLSYGGLGERDNQLHAIGVLDSYIFDRRNYTFRKTFKKYLYHPETSLNLLGHCYEMEGDYGQALSCYESSLHLFNTNNAANWHIRRVLRLISG